MSALAKIKILQIILWLICSAVIIIVIVACTPAQAGCHIVYGNLWCDPDLSTVITRVVPGLGDRFGIAPPYIAAPPPGRAPIVSAAYLTEACFSKEPLRNAGCAGFISGVADANAGLGLYCLPPDHFAAERAVIDYIHRVPMQGLPATQMVLDALRALFPCR